jgi:hypothetical protein
MMTPTQTRQVNSTRVIQADDNVLSIDAGKHSNVKENVVVTTSTPYCYSDPVKCTVTRLCQFNNKPIKKLQGIVVDLDLALSAVLAE